MLRVVVQFNSLPPGFLARVFLRGMREFEHVDFNHEQAAMYSLGHSVAIFSRRLEATDCWEITLQATNGACLNKAGDALTKVKEFFPGMFELDAWGLQRSKGGYWEYQYLRHVTMERAIESRVERPNMALGFIFRENGREVFNAGFKVVSSACRTIRMQPRPGMTLGNGRFDPTRERRTWPRVVLLMVDTGLAHDKKACEHFRLVHNAGIPIIPVIMPGYKIDTPSAWWPKSLPELAEHKLFVLPPWGTESFEEFLAVAEKSKGVQEGRYSEIKLKENITNVDFKIMKLVREGLHETLESRTAGWLYDRLVGTEGRGDAAVLLNQWRSSKQLIAHNPSCLAPLALLCGGGAGAGGGASLLAGRRSVRVAPGYAGAPTSCEPGAVAGREGEWEKPTGGVDESLPCPVCETREIFPPGCFRKTECVLFFSESNTKKEGTLPCGKCRTAVRVLDILVPEVFVSYSWGVQAAGGHFPIQEMAKKLQTSVEETCGLLVWLDVHGGIAAGDDHVRKMLEGVERARVVLVFLSDRYVMSVNCQLEFAHAVQHRRFILPCLVDGWTGPGPESEGWWEHARTLCRQGYAPYQCQDGTPPESAKPMLEDSHGRKLMWNALSLAEPLDLRGLEVEGVAVATSPQVGV
ncbi:hypothetical protein T484DRAFT_3221726 [Baffinella frigidus]|nr:hypothetical protein T484DRAFT_3221726 [Cryptophyta sp. CCMP2293]